jgi:vacuolar-type H+-ATPase subunit H
MSDNGAGGALGSVRELEGALEATATTRAASERRLDEARARAARLLAAARDDAAAAGEERRRVVLAAAEDDAQEIARDGERTAAGIRVDAAASCTAMVEAALALILPTRDESEA